MDSTKHAEGCSSSESGWTVYIASPMQEDDGVCSDYDDPDVVVDDGNAGADAGRRQEHDSDDSMASDASSGPHHHDRYEKRKGTTSFKHRKGNNGYHRSQAGKPDEKERKNDGNSIGTSRRFPANSKYSKQQIGDAHQPC